MSNENTTAGTGFTVPDFTTVDLPAHRPAPRPRGPTGRRRPRPPPAWSRPSRCGRRPRASTSPRSTRRPTPTASTSSTRTPASPPFLRGPYPTMYVNQPWTIRQYAGFSTAEDSNAFYRRNLAAGQKGLSVAFDLATHRGYDSDHPRVAGDVGMAGVAIDSIYDMRTLFDGIPLDQMSVSMTMNGAVLPVLALYIVAAEEQGVPPRAARRDHPERHPQGVHGPQHLHLSADALDADHLGHLRLHVAARCRSSTRSRSPATTCRRPGRRPTWSWPTRWPTASSTCGPASTPASTSTRSRRGSRFFWAIGMNFFMEVAKLRAARLLWAKLVKEQFDPKNAKSLSLRTHTQTSGWSLTAQDVFNNVVRTCVEAMAATQGHTQSLHTNALDEALALPTDFSARIARNTQLFLQQESGTTRVIDPWGGSYYVERLTDELAPPGAGPHRRGRGAGRHGQGHRGRHPQAAHRGGRRPHPGPHRLRPPDGDRRQQVPARHRRGRSTCSRSTTRRCAPASSPSSNACGPSATTPRSQRRSRRSPTPRRIGRRQPAGAGASTRPGPRRPSARSATRWRRSTAATGPRSARSRASTAARWATGEVPSTSVRAKVEAFEAADGRARASWSPRWARTATTAARR